MQLPKLFRSGKGGGGGTTYPRLLQENGAGLLTEDGDYLAMEGVDNPNIVDLPCVVWFDAMSLGRILNSGDAVMGWPNIAPGHTETASANPDYPAGTYIYEPDYGGYVAMAIGPMNSRLDITPAISWETLDAGGTPAGISSFVVCSLNMPQDSASGLYGDSNQSFGPVNLKTTYAPLVESVYAPYDMAFASAYLQGDFHIGGWPAYITPSARALVEYRVNFSGGQWHQSLFVDGLRQGTQTLVTGGVVGPVNQIVDFLGMFYTGNLYQVRIYSQQLSDADQLAVRRELCTKYALPFYTDL